MRSRTRGRVGTALSLGLPPSTKIVRHVVQEPVSFLLPFPLSGGFGLRVGGCSRDFWIVTIKVGLNVGRLGA